VTPLKIVDVTQRVKNPARPKPSQQVDSRTEGRSLRGGVRSRGEARAQAASLNSEKCIVVVNRIRPRKRSESRQCAVPGRQQSYLRYGLWVGNHRSLRAGQAFRGVTRELGRASRLLGSKSRSEGDRHKQHPGICWWKRPADEPTSAQAVRDTKAKRVNPRYRKGAKANQPGRTKAVVATQCTAGQGVTSARTRGEPRPKGPTITPIEAREGNAGHDVCARERQEGL
jgi:hypothetical protein